MNLYPFDPTFYTHSRAQALADGGQLDVSNAAAQAGIRFPVFLTRSVYDAYVTLPPQVVTCQDETGRLLDIMATMRLAICRAKPGQARLSFALYVQTDNSGRRLVKLIATCGPLDIDDAQPAITVLLPDED